MKKILSLLIMIEMILIPVKVWANGDETVVRGILVSPSPNQVVYQGVPVTRTVQTTPQAVLVSPQPAGYVYVEQNPELWMMTGALLGFSMLAVFNPYYYHHYRYYPRYHYTHYYRPHYYTPYRPYTPVRRYHPASKNSRHYNKKPAKVYHSRPKKEYHSTPDKTYYAEPEKEYHSKPDEGYVQSQISDTRDNAIQKLRRQIS
ncbi:MAG: hypothetical protein JW774_08505 [Candidatus Aureabacteria bacterium]|nr:hypothetical protein [Candidatus Auribacterota bacterium]